MSIVIDVLLGLGVAIVVFSAVGTLLVPEPFTRLHFLAPASTLGVPLIVVAVVLQQGTTRTSLKVGVVGALMLVGQPAVTSATGRALAAARGMAAPQETR